MSPTADSESAQPEPVRRRRLIAALAVIAAIVIAVDQLTKFWAESTLDGREPISVIGEFLQLRLLYNAGAAFSVASGLTWLLTIIVIAVIVIAIRVSRRVGSRRWALALGLLLGGAIGNLIDRLFRPPGFAEGHVVDFIDYNGWFVGNVADIAIVVGAALIALLSFRGIQVDGTRTATDAAGEPSPSEVSAAKSTQDHDDPS